MSAVDRIQCHTLTNAVGASVTICNFGAALVSFKVPDGKGCHTDLVLSYRDPARFFTDPPYFGKTVGRYANRIAKGQFALNGHTYQLCINNGPHHLHGGPGGIAFKFWEITPLGNRSLRCTCLSPDGEEHYPGNVSFCVDYTFTDACELYIHYTARPDRDTILNLTNHTYFNLNGVGSGSILDHLLTIDAANYLPIDSTSIPTGIAEPVAGTPFDFTSPKPIGKDINADTAQLHYGAGYDHCWILNGTPAKAYPGCHAAASLISPAGGRRLDIFTTQPGLQVYTGNWLEGSGDDQNGTAHHNRWGVALECQLFPDTPHHPQWPTAVVKANEVYTQTIIYKLTY